MAAIRQAVSRDADIVASGLSCHLGSNGQLGGRHQYRYCRPDCCHRRLRAGIPIREVYGGIELACPPLSPRRPQRRTQTRQ